MGFNSFALLFSRDLQELAALLAEPKLYEEFIYFNPDLHQKNNARIIYERLLALIMSKPPEDPARKIATIELEICLLKAKKHHLKNKANMTISDYEELIKILANLDTHYQNLYNLHKDLNGRDNYKTTIFSNKLTKMTRTIAKANDEKAILEYHLKVEAEQGKLELALKEIRLLNKNSTVGPLSLEQKLKTQKELYISATNNIDSLMVKLEGLHKNIFTLNKESDKPHSKNFLRKLSFNGPSLRNVELTPNLASTLYNPAIMTCLNEITRSFKIWFNPKRFLDNIDKLSYHTNKIFNTSSYEGYDKLEKILEVYFKQMSIKDIQYFYTNFKTKIAAWYIDDNTDMTIGDQTAMQTRAHLMEIVARFDKVLDKFGKASKFNLPANSINKKNGRNEDALTSTINRILTRAPQRTSATASANTDSEIKWSLHTTSEQAKFFFPNAHEKIYLPVGIFQNEEIEKIPCTIEDNDKIAALSSPAATSLAFENKLNQLSSSQAVNSALKDFLSKSKGSRYSLYDYCDLPNLQNSVSNSVVASKQIKQINLKTLKNGAVLCQVIRDITEVKNPENKALISNPDHKSLGTFETTFLFSPVGKNKVKLTIQEHNIYGHSNLLQKYIAIPTNDSLVKHQLGVG
jgi:hypothetical protein